MPIFKNIFEYHNLTALVDKHRGTPRSGALVFGSLGVALLRR